MVELVETHMVDIDALVAKAKQSLENTKPVTQEVMFGDELVAVRVWAIGGKEWRDLAAVNPPRAGSGADKRFGFNVDGVVRSYPRVALVTDDGEDLLRSIGRDGEVIYRWPELFDAMTAPDIENIAYAVWGLNVWDHQQKLVDAKKASTGGRQKKPASPAN